MFWASRTSWQPRRLSENGMPKRAPKTAGEFMDELSRAAKYQARRMAQDQRVPELQAVCAADERMLVKQILGAIKSHRCGTS